MKDKKGKLAKVHSNLGSIDVSVTEFGEVGSSLDIDKINRFLDENVEDKKLSEEQVKSSNK